MKWSLFEKGIWRRRLAFGLCLVLLLGILPFPDGMGGSVEMGKITAEAEENVPPFKQRYYFSVKGDFVAATGGDTYTMGSSSEVLSLYDSFNEGGLVTTGTTITLNENNSKNVVEAVVNKTGGNRPSETSIQLTVRGPGKTTIKGTIINANNESLEFSFNVEVELDLDKSKPTDNKGKAYYYNMRPGTDQEPEGHSLKVRYPGIKHQLAVKYVTPSNGAISGDYKYDYSGTDLEWVSDNENVIKIAGNGIEQAVGGVLEAVGAGYSKVEVSIPAMGGNGKQSETLEVVVPLEFSATAPAITSGSTVTLGSYAGFSENLENVKAEVDEEGVGTVKFYSTAYDPMPVKEDKYKTMSYQLFYEGTDKEVSTDLYTFDASGMEEMKHKSIYGASEIRLKLNKAGNYVFRAQMDRLPNNIDERNFQAEVHFEVPIVAISGRSVWMNVGDKFSFFNNTNLSEDDIKNYRFETEDGSKNIVEANTNTGIVTAKRKGEKIVYGYPKKYNSYEEAVAANAPVFSFIIHVIDTLSMNLEEATIPVGTTIDLEIFSTNPSVPVKWEVSEEGIISWDPLDSTRVVVKGEKEGEVEFVATQTIGGVEKSVTCRITVIGTTTGITLNPSQMDLAIGESKGIKAIISPALTKKVKLHWVSSDETIVSVDDPNNRTDFCSVTGKKAGTAIIMAINQDNMVVGSCIVTVTLAPGGITLSETNLTLPQSVGKYQLYATVTPADATDKTVSWKSSNEKVAKVDQNGVITFVGSGTVTIIATSNGDPTKQAFCEITVMEPVTSLTLDQSSITLEVGNTHRLPNNAYDRSVTFVSMDTKVATVNSTGLVTAKKAGTTYVTVTTADGGYSKVCTVIVKQAATTIKLDATGLLLDVGEFYNLEATFNPKTTTETKLRWSSNDTSVAKVDTKGRVTGVAEGTCVITVTTENNLAAFCYVTVNQQVTGVELNYDSVTVDKGKTIKLTATVLPDNATNQKVKWTTSNASVAAVSASGTVRGIGGGAAIITCTTEEGGYIAVCMVQVIEKVTSIKLNKSSYKLGLGKKFTLTAKVQNSAATNQTVTWKSSNPKVCSVSKKGVITGLKLGTATITAYAKDGSEAEASCEVRVVRQATSLTLNRGLLNMVVGDNATLKAKIKPSNATYKTPNYTSSDSKIAIVDTNGRVTAIAAGTCNITAKAKDSSGLKAVCVVIVRPVVASTAITLNPTQVTMGVGGSETINYSLRPVDSTDSVVWSTNNRSVATVGKTSGIIRGVAPGTAVVTATTTSGRIATVQVTVVGLNYTSLTLEQYDSYLLRVMGVTSGIIWDVDNPDICTVTGGRVRAKKAGTTTVVARVNGAELRCRVTVTDIRQD
ncbi:MAG: Ig-like domain-containing protein [Lachnospiraceae bacterium]|nr:Ig-like domain-containing protein [Lachnospiraceae bacterium]